MSFARFMELALYCPIYGFYEKEPDTVGRRGDYYTSVSVGSLFGELLGFRFVEWLEEGQMTQIVEAGAHDGKLAKDILGWMRTHHPMLFEHLEYWIIEPSERRRHWQMRQLSEFSDNVRWIEDVAGAVKSGGVRGIIFSNELLDAMPARRLGWDAGNRVWFEWGVALEQGNFVWKRLSRDGLRQDPSLGMEIGNGLLDVLPDGFATEWNPSAEKWWSNAAAALQCGTLMTIDYGLQSEEFFAPERPKGTLRAYRKHHIGGDLLAEPGEQDLTSHVNFTTIRRAGESQGLITDALLTQSQFLTQIASRTWGGESSFGEWTAERRRQFQTLTHPEHLGRPFRVLIQSRPK